MSAQNTHPTETVYVGDDWILPRTIAAPFLPLTGKTFEWIMVSRGALDVVIPAGVASVLVLDAMTGEVEVHVPASVTNTLSGSQRYDDALRLVNGTDGTRATVVTGQIHALHYAFDATGGALIGPPGPVGPEGPVGPQGPIGPPGPMGASSNSFEYRFSSDITPPPTIGMVKLNNADPTLATKMYVNDMADDATDIHNYLRLSALDTTIMIQDKDNSSNAQVFRQTSASVLQTGGYTEIDVVWDNRSLSPIINNQRVVLAFR